MRRRTPSRGHQQGPQAGIAVAIDAATHDQLAERVFEFGAQQVGALRDLVEERSPVFGQVHRHALGARTQGRVIPRWRSDAAPLRRRSARQQQDGRGSQ